MIRVPGLLLLLFVHGLEGCGGGGDAVSPARAQADCMSFVNDVLCPKMVMCQAQQTQADCVSFLRETGLDCSAIGGENGELEVCERDVSSAACATPADSGTAFVPPPSCKGVFKHS
ncbi:MAG TPA: hypothetical protein VHL80_14995 [Polyangia bacterium]|nr:hypothetical protein [Polyangia bacterium]